MRIKLIIIVVWLLLFELWVINIVWENNCAWCRFAHCCLRTPSPPHYQPSLLLFSFSQTEMIHIRRPCGQCAIPEVSAKDWNNCQDIVGAMKSFNVDHFFRMQLSSGYCLLQTYCAQLKCISVFSPTTFPMKDANLECLGLGIRLELPNGMHIQSASEARTDRSIIHTVTICVPVCNKWSQALSIPRACTRNKRKKSCEIYCYGRAMVAAAWSSEKVTFPSWRPFTVLEGKATSRFPYLQTEERHRGYAEILLFHRHMRAGNVELRQFKQNDWVAFSSQSTRTIASIVFRERCVHWLPWQYDLHEPPKHEPHSPR